MKHQENMSLNVFLLTGICVSTILSIRNWPLNAEYGLASLSLILGAACVFLIPVALVSAELATGWPTKGGMFSWIEVAFGSRIALAAIWFIWVSNIIWYPTVLSFIATSIAYAVSPQIASSPYWIFFLSVLFFWCIILLNIKGTKFSSLMSFGCLILGTIFPGILIIIFGFKKIFQGEALQISLHMKDFIPKISGIKELVFFTGLLLGFFGIELPAVYANEVNNPQRSYPKAILFASSIIILLSVLGTFSVALIIPADKINFISAPLEVISIFSREHGISWIFPVLAILVGIGAFGSLNNWVLGPSKGLLVAMSKLELPTVLAKKNKKDIPVGLLVFMGIIVTLISLIFLIMPSLNSSFWVLTVATSQLYLISYIIMFMAGISLRYNKADVPRRYKIPFSNLGMWFIGGLGIISSCFAIFVGFFPPAQLEIGNKIVYSFSLFFTILALGTFPCFFKSKKLIAQSLSRKELDIKSI